MKPRCNSTKQQRGSVTVLFALLLPMLIGVGAYTIDIAYFFLVRNQLQNDADAAALVGARHLYDGVASTPTWATAEQKALAAVSYNRAADADLKEATVRSGYWNLSDASPSLKPGSSTPVAYDAPAVEVLLSRATGINGGPIKTFFLNYFGITTQTLQVKAVAGLSSPGATRIFPFAVANSLFQNYWNASTLPVGPKIDPKTNKPYIFQLTGATGGWVDLSATSNSAGLVSDWRLASAPVLTSLGQSVWPQPGTMATNYKDVSACSASAKYPVDRVCEYVYMPILSDVQAKNAVPVLGFACMHILDASQGGKYIQAEMSTQCPVMPGQGVAANYYGAKSSPALFR
jgi:Flp pilus assembly protein TadG